MRNIIVDGTFDNPDDLNRHWRKVNASHADQGWMVFNAGLSNWDIAANNQNLRAVNDDYSQSLIQVIAGQHQGLHTFSFDALNLSLRSPNTLLDNTLQVQVFGINGDFEVGHWGTWEPTTNNGTVRKLFDTGNIGTRRFGWQTIEGQIDLGQGYDYIVTRLITEGVDQQTEYQALDNVELRSTVSTETNAPFGVNLASINAWSTQLPFIDSFKSASPWWITGSQNQNRSLNLDPNGWVKSLPVSRDGSKIPIVTNMHTGIDGRYPGGRYVVLYEGKGNIQYQGDARIVRHQSRPGRDVINVNPTDTGIRLKIRNTDPQNTGDYIRNIRVIPQAYESTYQTQRFNPAFLEKVEPFSAFRFMNWMQTVDSTQKDWWNRPTLDDHTWFEDGAPIEVMVELANAADVDPWFNIPHEATDQYVRGFARYVRENLEPERKVYVEYSNEVWNGKYEQSRWIQQQINNDPNFTGNVMNWYGKRSTEVMEIWDQEFGEDKEKVIGVLNAQFTWMRPIRDALDYDVWSNENKTHEDYGIDAISVAPYVGYYIAHRRNEGQVENWNLNQVFDELTEGGVLSGGPDGGAMQAISQQIGAYANLARRENLQLLAYEGGSGLAGPHVARDNETIIDLLHRANRDPRMGQIYEDLLTNWYDQGGGLFVHFDDISRSDQFGNRGLLEYVGQEGSEKYDSVINLMNTYGN